MRLYAWLRTRLDRGLIFRSGVCARADVSVCSTLQSKCALRLAWLLLLTVLPSGCLLVRGQRYQNFTTPTPIATDEFLVVGFLGGRDSWDNAEVGVGRLAVRLRNSGIDRMHIETVENKKRDLALTLVRNSFDRNSDGHIDGLERSSIGLIVYGQSFGGAAVVKFARQMDELDIPILLTIQVDSIGIGDGVIPPNVRTAANLFQRDGWIIRGEPEIRAEDPARTHILGNFRFSYGSRQIDLTGLSWFKKIGRVAHTKMDRDPEVWDQVEELIRNAVERARVPIFRSAVEPVLGIEGAGGCLNAGKGNNEAGFEKRFDPPPCRS